MALSFKGIEPVQFGDRTCTPAIITAEQKLRLDRIDFNTNDGIKKADQILAASFPDDEAYVLDFLKKMTTIDKQMLKAYLTGGERAVASIEDGIRSAIIESMKAAQ